MFITCFSGFFFAFACIQPFWGTTLGPWTALFNIIRRWWRNTSNLKSQEF